MMNIKELQKIELEMLAFIMKISKKYELNYILMGGTLLGTIRHKGFIPWDDDVDVGFIRDEYTQLLDILHEEIKGTPYKLVSEFSEKEYGLAFSKLVDTRYPLNDKSNRNNVIQNVFVDIFPYDKVVGTTFSQWIQFKKFQFWNIAILNKTNYKRKRKLLPSIIVKCQLILLSIYSVEKMKKKRERTLTQHAELLSGYNVTNFSARGFRKEYVSLKDISTFIDGKFDGIIVDIPSGYDNILSHMYGNYMELPPEYDQVGRHSGLE